MSAASGVVFARDKPSLHLLPPRQLPIRREAQWAAEPTATNLPHDPRTPFLSGAPKSLLFLQKFTVCGSFQGGREMLAPTHTCVRSHTLTRTHTGTAGHWAAFPDRKREALPRAGP